MKDEALTTPGAHTDGPSEAELVALREELTGVHGDAYWRKLEDLAGTGPFQAFLRRWFPSQAPRFGTEVERRGFLRLMGGSLAALGLGACTRQPDEKIVPFASAPENQIPGRPRSFATAFPCGGDVLGLLVESHMGRPTKVEGNPDHPASLGATNTFAQAEILSLYDPDRSHSILRAGQISTWSAFLGELERRLDGSEATQGEGLAFLVEDGSSPTLIAQLEELQRRLPRVRVHHWTPVHRDEERDAALETFGRDVTTRYAFDRARVILSLDADFLASGPGGVRYARDFAAGRRAREGETEAANRLYAVESSVTLTGAMADHRLALRPSDVDVFARVLAAELGLAVPAPEASQELSDFARAVARDLSTHAGAGVVVPGAWQSATVHALAHRINHALRNSGKTVLHTEPVEPWVDAATESIAALVDDIRADRVATLLVLGGNPVLDAPADLDFADALKDVPFRVHLSLDVDETSRLCQWHVPMAHPLESWSDARTFDGTVSVVQPLIAPLHGGRTAHELVAAAAGEPETSAYDLLRARWQVLRGEGPVAFERFWRTALHDGVVEGTTYPTLELEPAADWQPTELAPGGRLQVSLRPDASVFDGRYANNGWLQETPRPLTRLTWDNAALVAPATAEELGVDSGDLVEISSGDRRLEAPVWVTPGHPERALTLHLGYGRTSAGGLGTGVGVDAYRARTSYAPWSLDDASVRKAGGSVLLASVQDHARMEGRELVRVTTFDRFARDPRATADHLPHDLSELTMYAEHESDGYAWGMVIDLNACIGCNACMVACQSENNIPIVGKDEVALGRELHWIRIDRYYEGDEAAPEVLHQPVPCMHCENAPCEVVCPVGATVHGDEGLNEMVYNRCVGTRYCANNCPYKVRRFNYYAYADFETESLKLANNPDVTVRSRGVMEKCTYCVQRINSARITAKKDGRTIGDGEVRTACQQVCPTQAIVFGDINDDASAVSADRREPHHYGLLDAALNTRPRTTYLAKLTNPNPDLEGAG
jgi:molybdopterin-containing oxidoreductase family iron-sulfur binding subunit